MSWLFESGGQTIGASASASVLPMTIQCWFPLVWLPCSSSNSQESSPTPQFESICSSRSAFLMVQLSHLYVNIGKTIALTTQTFAGKVMSLLFNMPCRFVIAFLPRSKQVFNLVTVNSDFGAQENKTCRCFRFPPSMCQATPGFLPQEPHEWYEKILIKYSFENPLFVLLWDNKKHHLQELASFPKGK